MVYLNYYVDGMIKRCLA